MNLFFELCASIDKTTPLSCPLLNKFDYLRCFTVKKTFLGVVVKLHKVTLSTLVLIQSLNIHIQRCLHKLSSSYNNNKQAHNENQMLLYWICHLFQ